MRWAWLGLQAERLLIVSSTTCSIPPGASSSGFHRATFPFSRHTQNPLSEHTSPPGKPGSQMVQSRPFKYYLYADSSQMCASSLDLSPGLQARSSDCLFGISTWMFNGRLRLHRSKTQLQLCPCRTPSPLLLPSASVHGNFLSGCQAQSP